MNNKGILFRAVDWDNRSEEFEVVCAYFPTYLYRSQVPDNSLVIGRYSVLPFYKELEDELAFKNCILINSMEQHEYIADICNYYQDIKDFTPKTYTQWGDIGDGRWVVKGKTNSRKFRWNTHMYAEGRSQLLDAIRNLHQDQMIADQGIVVREYVPLAKLGEGINGLPISKEWRCFCYKNNILATGFYWGNFQELDPGSLPKGGLDFVQKIADIISLKTNFFVIDVAEKEDGGFIVIEINDGQQSGLSMVDPKELYSHLRDVLVGDLKDVLVD